eukprot:scaffold130466_cov72-Phaeocystis_antarctica.AAC.2
MSPLTLDKKLRSRLLRYLYLRRYARVAASPTRQPPPGGDFSKAVVASSLVTHKQYATQVEPLGDFTWTAAYPAYLFLYNTHMRKGTFQGKKHAGRHVVPIRAAERLGKKSSCPSWLRALSRPAPLSRSSRAISGRPCRNEARSGGAVVPSVGISPAFAPPASSAFTVRVSPCAHATARGEGPRTLG